MKRVAQQSSKGFTIVELLIVIVVIAILAAITIVAYNGIQNRTKVSAVQSAVSQAVKKVQAYAITNTDNYPSNATDAGLPTGSGTSYEVTSNNTVSPKAYCVTVTTNGLTYFQTSTMNAPIPGTCVGMLAWWTFDGNAQDSSGNGVSGTVTGATLTNGADGTANGAYQLGETGQYINVGTPASFSALPSAFTYSVWVARTGTSTNQWPQVMGSSNTHLDFGIRTAAYGTNVYLEWGISPFDGAAYTGTGTTGALTTMNEWHHMLVTYNGSVVQSYWDGALRTTSGVTAMRPTMANFSFTTATNGWQGKVDDARVYNRALSIDEVKLIYSTGAQ